MAFQLKDFTSILASMVNWMRTAGTPLTDWSVGSPNRTLLEAPAAELDQLYQEMFHGIKEAIPVATYQSFSFDLLPAVRASGLLTFSVPTPAASNITIPVNTPVRSEATGIIYETAQAAVIQVGQISVDVLAVATVPGTEGNATAGTITDLQVSIPNVSATNQASLSNGRDQETEAERKVRFQGFISTLARGVLEAVRYGAETTVLRDSSGLITERVVYAELVEPYKTNPAGPIALVLVYIHNGVGSTSTALVDEAQRIIDGYRLPDGTAVIGWKAAGVVVEVYAADEVTQDVIGELVLTSTADPTVVLPEAELVAREYLLSLRVGEQCIRHELVERIMSIPGVFDLVLTDPAANSAIDPHEKIMPGTIQFTEAP